MFLFFLTEKNPNFLLLKKNGGYPGELNQHDHNIICLTIVNSGKKLKFKFFSLLQQTKTFTDWSHYLPVCGIFFYNEVNKNVWN